VIPGSEFIIDVDTVVVSVGTMANPIVASTTPGLETNRWGYIITKGDSGETTREGVYAGRRYRDGFCDSHSRHGCGPPGRAGDSRVSVEEVACIAKKLERTLSIFASRQIVSHRIATATE